ncbi:MULTISPECIES: cytochrome c [unclassified Bradyrhizobium]|uniref:c-type cytochrome n=1 Tax=unclassified Bradyrhizobium TaxID=2631580 RepID=UPI001BA4FAF6|nr:MULTISPECIES: cytochrome c [unclassified Bradyrhizobium]MBR1207728.1 cytochrome c [Bradyrhizobium sp. AUGA SZCCT0124]MBR1316267.1 cytochrome c [Bradyrhizobium sp. AUGA SZCCT0051]MBR1344278.1 cytochrome c [Bradyrhizobium sp. AUGA SZCCT0105]MBR1359289.1 cytochrome c [Bradyrhizobium sp. AUGA SZCCT0045]
MLNPHAVWRPALPIFVVVMAALLLLRLHQANGAGQPSESIAAGHRLAEAWCMECHVIGAIARGAKKAPPDFAAVANRPSTTMLSLKVFLKTSHPTMPNIIIGPGEADDLANYIMSLKRE